MSRETPSYENADVVKYWFKHYATTHCTLCGNSGCVDSIGTVSAAGIPVGRLNYCICPNGQGMRHRGDDLTKVRKARRR